MLHVMIDIETMGTRPNAPILTIGAVKFDPETGALGQEFYRAIDVSDALKYGAPDGETLKWWLTQSEAARKAVVAGTTPLRIALADLSGFYTNWDQVKVCGNGPGFDMTILEYGFWRALDLNPIWKFWNIRCCRTIAEISGMRPPKIAGSGVHHNALDDAKHQAAWVSRYWQMLRDPKRDQAAPTAPANDIDDLLGL